jgi:hypothetical protein
MIHKMWIGAPIAVSLLFLGACSPSAQPPASETPAKSAAPAKPAYDFGKITLTPATGNGREATLRLVQTGGTKPSFLGVLINATQTGEHACYLIQNFVGNDTMLVADSGSGTTALGARKSLSNGQCEVFKEGSTSTADGTGVTVTFRIRFAPVFRGLKHIWAVPLDIEMKGPDMAMVGDWTVE